MARRRPLGDIPGTIEDLRWTSDGTSAGRARRRSRPRRRRHQRRRSAWPGARPRTPPSTNPTDARRRLFKVDACRRDDDGGRAGRSQRLGIRPARRRRRGRARLGRPERARLVSRRLGQDRLRVTRRRRCFTRSRWQLQAPAARPSGTRVAFLEGWSSDRGLVASEISILDLATTARLSTARAGRHVERHDRWQWRDEDSLWFAGWSKLGSIYGVVRTRRNSRLDRRYEDAIIGTNSFTARHFAGARQDGLRRRARDATARRPRSCSRRRPTRRGRRSRSLNAEVASGLQRLPRGARHRAGRARTASSWRACVLLPRDGGRGPLPTIVDIHGGPSWAAKYAFNPGYAAAVRGGRLRRLPSQLSRQCRLGPGVRAAQYRRSGRRRVRGHPRRHRSHAWPKASPIPTASASPARATAAT